MPKPRVGSSFTLRIAAVACAVSIVAAACGGGSGDGGSVAVDDGVESGFPADPSPTRGGVLVYGLKAETNLTSGYCIPEAQLVTSGIQVARAFYDPLVVPDGRGGYVPYLASSIESDDTNQIWTIGLREGVEFHDGTKLDATVVKNNLDAYRGDYDGRSSLLIAQVFSQIESVEVLNELTLRVHLDRPWVSFPATLYAAGRVVIMAQEQLDAPSERCAAHPIGTGPFVFDGWDPNVSIRGRAFDRYWQIAPDGEPYPYVDAVDFRPIPNSDERIAALQQGEINMLHTSTPSDVTDSLRGLRDAGEVNLLVSSVQTESDYVIVNTSGENGANPVLARPEARRAISMAIDRQRLNDEANDGLPELANGPFPPGVLGHLEDTGQPGYDLEAAKEIVAELEADGEDLSLRFLATSSPSFIEIASMGKEMLEEAGFRVTLEIVEEADLVSQVIAGDYDLSSMRNQPGDDPDANAHWWRGYEGNILNFGRFSDEVIDDALETGRDSEDDDVRREAYETINRRFAEQQYNIYLWWAPWAIAESAEIHGILGPDLPDGSEASTRIVTGHPLHGIWIEK